MFAKHYAKYYELLNQWKPYKQEIEFVYGWANNPERIFDIGCGTGEYWKHYPKNTYLCGVEKSFAMIEKVFEEKGIVNANIEDYESNATFDCATALFNVINYIPQHRWWHKLPIEKDGFFIFDIWDKEKVDKDQFTKRTITFGNITRTITPLKYDGKMVELDVRVDDDGVVFTEHHRMFVYSEEDIQEFCTDQFVIDKIKKTKDWQTWYRLKRK